MKTDQSRHPNTTCQACVHFHPLQAEPLEGECRANPPTVLERIVRGKTALGQVQQRIVQTAAFPHIVGTGWCGQHRRVSAHVQRLPILPKGEG